MLTCCKSGKLENSDREEDHVVGIKLYRNEILEEKGVGIEVLEKLKSISKSGKPAEIV